MKGRWHNLWVALGRNRSGWFLVITEEKGEVVSRIFRLEGTEAGGWWRMMVTMFKVVRRNCQFSVKVGHSDHEENREEIGGGLQMFTVESEGRKEFYWCSERELEAGESVREDKIQHGKGRTRFKIQNHDSQNEERVPFSWNPKRG